MKLSKYSYRTRLITGFSLIILFNILSIFISLNKIQENQDDLNLMYAHPLVVSNAVREINSDINAIHRTMKDVALSKNRQELAKALKRVMGYDENIKKNFRVVLDRFLGDIKLVKKAEETYLNWRPIRLQVIDLIEQGEKEAAAKITKTIGDDYVFSLLNTTQEMIDFAKHKADQLYFDNLKKQKKASRQLYVLLLSLSILSFIIALIISKSISAPIKKLVSRITQSLDKDFNKESVFFMRSEQETLELAIKALEEYHEKITNFNKNLNQKVQEKTKNLTEANKSLQDLVYIASHDLQVPLVSMVGFTTELLEEHKDSLNKDGVYCLTRIQSNAKRMHKLVLSLLDLSRLNTHINPYQEFSLSKMISEILKDLSLTISKAKTNITYSKLSKIYADKQRIEGVFRNLIQNAISYEAKNIEIGFDKDTFFIKDDGIGIPKDQLQKIFLAGERLKFNNAEGVGMGLAFCKKAIELHGGAIWAESNGHNKGAIFYIKFTSNTLIS